MNSKLNKKIQAYDVIIVGAGHAGLEAAFACAKAKLKTCLITLNQQSIASCPCNPSIGGPAKGIVTREIDALGGMQANAADHCRLQIKILNESKGAGVQALRAQIDKIKYHEWFVKEIKKQKNLTIVIDEVLGISIKKNNIDGVYCKNNKKIICMYLIITTGTYMLSKVHIGQENKMSGPIYDQCDDSKVSTLWSTNSSQLSLNLKTHGFKIIRLKTGTPPRVYRGSIDFKKMQEQPGSEKKLCFNHFLPIYTPIKKQALCWLTHTNQKTHKIIQKNLHKSAMYSGNIKGIGPRYCPSIEDKVVRFSEKPRHQLFIEPESIYLDTMYIQGLSTSLPKDVQEQIVHSIKGLEHAKIQRHAYAIEYDAIDPTQLYETLETKKIKNLFFAGQVNGTSGYEEAAGQGLIAGINAIAKYYHLKPLILKRNEAYIGVMINDITTKGVNDPYRLLTTRAEYRLLLRNDNAINRLIEYGYYYHLISRKQINDFNQETKKIATLIKWLKQKKRQNISYYDLIKRPENQIESFVKDKKFSNQILSKIAIMIKYEGYIKNQQKSINQYEKMLKINLTKINDYRKIKNLSLEAIDKLNKNHPTNMAQASQISGVTINDLLAIKIYLEKTHE